MDIAETPHACHLFVCGHRRSDGRASCGDRWDADEACAWLKSAFRERGLAVRVSPSGCLGPCGDGPNLLAHPPGLWFRHVRREDLPAVVERIEAFIRPAPG